MIYQSQRQGIQPSHDLLSDVNEIQQAEIFARKGGTKYNSSPIYWIAPGTAEYETTGTSMIFRACVKQSWCRPLITSEARILDCEKDASGYRGMNSLEQPKQCLESLHDWLHSS